MLLTTRLMLYPVVLLLLSFRGGRTEQPESGQEKKCEDDSTTKTIIALAEDQSQRIGYYKAHASALWRIKLGTEHTHRYAYEFLDIVTIKKEESGFSTIKFAENVHLCAFNDKEVIACPSASKSSLWKILPVGDNRFQLVHDDLCMAATYSKTLVMRKCGEDPREVFMFAEIPEMPKPDYSAIIPPAQQRVVEYMDKMLKEAVKDRSFYDRNYHPALHMFKTNPHVGDTKFRSPVFSKTAHSMHVGDFIPMGMRRIE